MNVPHDALEGLMRCAVGVAQILAVGAGVKLFVGAGIMRARKYARAKQWALCGLLLAVIGIPLSRLGDALFAVNDWLGLVSVIPIAIVVCGWAWHVWWLPYTIARNGDDNPHPGLLFACLFSQGIPPVWWIALYFAARTKTDDSIEASSAVPPLLAKCIARVRRKNNQPTLECGQLNISPVDAEPR